MCRNIFLKIITGIRFFQEHKKLSTWRRTQLQSTNWRIQHWNTYTVQENTTCEVWHIPLFRKQLRSTSTCWRTHLLSTFTQLGTPFVHRSVRSTELRTQICEVSIVEHSCEVSIGEHGCEILMKNTAASYLSYCRTQLQSTFWRTKLRSRYLRTQFRYFSENKAAKYITKSTAVKYLNRIQL